MDIYLTLFAAGGLGLVLMGALGLGAHSFHAGGHTGAHVGAGHAGANTAAGHSAAVAHAHPGSQNTQSRATENAWSLLALLSPRVLFTLIFGAGATGLIAQEALGLGGIFLAIIAALGAVAIEAFLVRPFWKFLFRFESAPAMTLESAIMDHAIAGGNFDATGSGIVSINLDGQTLRLLARLTPPELEAGVTVRRGDQVRVISIDPRRNRCEVSREDTPMLLSTPNP